MTTKEPRLICLGDITGGGYEKYLEHNRRVYDPDGVSATLTTGMTARINVMDEDKREHNERICRSE